MMARRSAIGTGVSAFFAVLGGCNPFASNNSIRFRLTLSVNTPSGLKTASSVLEFVRHKSWAVLRPIDTGSQHTFGQAPALRFGARGALFALLKDPLYERPLDRIVRQAIDGRGLDKPLSRKYESADWKEAFTELKAEEVSGTVDPINYPMFVWIPDLDDLLTAQEISPSWFGTIGAGVSFAGLSFQFVSDRTDIDLDLPERFPMLFNPAPHAFGRKPKGSLRSEHLARSLRTPHFFVSPDGPSAY